MWFGTQNGLARFDGYDIRIFRNEPDNPNSISHNNIWCLLEGKSGCIWIGTRNGDLNRYDTEKDLFEKYNICNSNDEENYISCLYEHSDGSLWIGTYNKGLYNFNQKDKSIQHWNHIPGDSSSLSNDFINGIVPDSDGNLWVGTYSGLNRFSLSGNNKYFKKYFTEDGLSNNLIWRIVRSENPHVLYIGTYNGLTVMNLKTHTFEVMLFMTQISNYLIVLDQLLNIQRKMDLNSGWVVMVVLLIIISYQNRNGIGIRIVQRKLS
jgi:ligand-binding sensor domain-containing protein